MDKEIRNIIELFWYDEISKEDLLSKFEEILKKISFSVQDYFKSIYREKNGENVQYAMEIGYLLKDDKLFIDLIHKLISEPWHTSYEEMVHYLQSKKKPESVEHLKRAMQKRYDYLESYGTGTRQFINQCGHALWSIGTDEAINVIRDLTKSSDPIIVDEMLYRVSRIEGRSNYERNYSVLK